MYFRFKYICVTVFSCYSKIHIGYDSFFARKSGRMNKLLCDSKAWVWTKPLLIFASILAM